MENSENKKDIILKRVKETIKSTDPTARVFLYGSRARGDARKDSDWDFMILIKQKRLTNDIEFSFRNQLYILELDFEELISSVIVTEDKWTNPIFMQTPFYQSVITEGIEL